MNKKESLERELTLAEIFTEETEVPSAEADAPVSESETALRILL